jgi:hypothetical protein
MRRKRVHLLIVHVAQILRDSLRLRSHRRLHGSGLNIHDWTFTKLWLGYNHRDRLPNQHPLLHHHHCLHHHALLQLWRVEDDAVYGLRCERSDSVVPEDERTIGPN